MDNTTVKYRIVIKKDAAQEITFSEGQNFEDEDNTGTTIDADRRAEFFKAQIKQITDQLRDAESSLQLIIEQWRDALDEDDNSDEEDSVDELEEIASDLDSALDDLENFVD